jgi:hypothetical protein
MAKKVPTSPTKPWSPGDPLRLDKVIQRKAPAPHGNDRLTRVDDAMFAQRNAPNHPVKPTNTKTFSHQKKG